MAVFCIAIEDPGVYSGPGV